MSWKDIRVLGLVVLLLMAGLFPIYQMGIKNSEKARCTQNFMAIYQAMNLYARDHDDGLPPLFRTGNGFVPGLGEETGRPYTWASDIVGYMGERGDFRCPSAKPQELVRAEHPQANDQSVTMSYGMYSPYGGYKTYNIENPDQTVLVAETSNLGTMSSYDPVPFKNADGSLLPDGFVIGWNDGNEVATSKSTKVTRLAFQNTASGTFGEQGIGRHTAESKQRKAIQVVHALTATGSKVNLTPGSAEIVQRDNLPSGLWSVPASNRRRR
jgi:hypothetical protein